MYKLSVRSTERLEGINIVLIDIIEKSIVNSPYDFGIPQYGGLRTAEDQKKLYDVKRKSYHQSGNAFDIYAYVNKKASWEKHHLESIARHIQQIAKEHFNVSLRWGGDFKTFYDGPHFEIRT